MINNEYQSDNKKDFPRHLLGNSIEEAEENFNKFSELLNNIAYSYYSITGIDKGDLFAEAVFGLARALRDFDDNRSKDFVVYAIFIIKDALNEYVRNYYQISTPSYLRKAANLVEKLKAIFTSNNIEIDWNNLDYSYIENSLPDSQSILCKELLAKLNNYADRAKIKVSELITRIQLIPRSFDYEHKHNEIDLNEKTNNSILVKQLLEQMSVDEKKVAIGIMQDKTYQEIGKTLGKSNAWVSDKIKTMQKKFKRDCL